VLIVPSLVNRGYILDLNAERSFLRYLAGLGFRPFMMDWGRPGPEEAEFGLDDYICDLLGEALDIANEQAGGPVPVIGYCMGGVLSLGLTALKPDQVSDLILLATPWDFHADDPTQFEVAAAFSPMLPAVLQTWGELPVDALQALFASLDVFGTGRKFRSFHQLPQEGPKAKAFVALEDWLNDGVPLAKRVAVEVLSGWYVRNLTGSAKWRVDGKKVDPTEIHVPSLVVVPSKDRIVPPKTALALADQLSEVKVLRPDAGHIGMMVGASSRAKVWQPITDWLLRRTNQG
jgi:polyhydroxyalkanoate synthase